MKGSYFKTVKEGLGPVLLPLIVPQASLQIGFKEINGRKQSVLFFTSSHAVFFWSQPNNYLVVIDILSCNAVFPKWLLIGTHQIAVYTDMSVYEEENKKSLSVTYSLSHSAMQSGTDLVFI